MVRVRARVMVRVRVRARVMVTVRVRARVMVTVRVRARVMVRVRVRARVRCCQGYSEARARVRIGLRVTDLATTAATVSFGSLGGALALDDGGGSNNS